MKARNELVELVHKHTGIVLSNRLAAILVNNGIRDLEDIAVLTWEKVRLTPEFGPKSWKEVEDIQNALKTGGTDLAGRLSYAINQMLEAANAIAEITNLAMVDPDIRYIDHFKEIHKAPLIRSADEIETILSPTADSIRTLALVLYVKDMETISPVGNWRALVATRPVEAIRILRNDIDKLDLREAKMVVDAYKKNPF